MCSNLKTISQNVLGKVGNTLQKSFKSLSERVNKIYMKYMLYINQIKKTQLTYPTLPYRVCIS